MESTMKVNFYTPAVTVLEMYRNDSYVINMHVKCDNEIEFRVYESDTSEVCMLNVTSKFPKMLTFADLRDVIDVLEFDSSDYARQQIIKDEYSLNY